VRDLETIDAELTTSRCGAAITPFKLTAEEPGGHGPKVTARQSVSLREPGSRLTTPIAELQWAARCSSQSSWRKWLARSALICSPDASAPQRIPESRLVVSSRKPRHLS
jgi:hypothetical protein